MQLARLFFPGERQRKARHQFRAIQTGLLVGLFTSAGVVTLILWLATRH
jgi:hypothetical protein